MYISGLYSVHVCTCSSWLPLMKKTKKSMSYSIRDGPLHFWWKEGWAITKNFLHSRRNDKKKNQVELATEFRNIPTKSLKWNYCMAWCWKTNSCSEKLSILPSFPPFLPQYKTSIGTNTLMLKNKTKQLWKTNHLSWYKFCTNLLV